LGRPLEEIVILYLETRSGPTKNDDDDDDDDLSIQRQRLQGIYRDGRNLKGEGMK
jgi:hypothetical protein